MRFPQSIRRVLGLAVALFAASGLILLGQGKGSASRITILLQKLPSRAP